MNQNPKQAAITFFVIIFVVFVVGFLFGITFGKAWLF